MKQQPKTVNLLLLLFVLVLILASVSSSLFGGRENAGLTYSGVLDLFEQEQVESFVLTGNSLALAPARTVQGFFRRDRQARRR